MMSFVRLVRSQSASQWCVVKRSGQLRFLSGKNLLARDIPTVELAFDKFDEYSPKDGVVPLDEEGAKQPVLILHGLFGSKSNNRSVAKMLNKKLFRDVYCLDLRNHGKSPHIARHDYPALSADVERFIETHKLHKPIIVGHSMGAKTVMALSLRRPDLISLMVSVDNSPVNLQPSSTFPRYCSILQDIVSDKNAQTINSLRGADEYFSKFEPDATVRQFLLTNLRTNPDTKRLESRIPLDIMKDALVKGEVSAWEFDPNENQWFGPSLFLRGVKSKYVPDDYLPAIALYFPNFEVKDLDCGHWVLAEKPKESVELIVDFVERHEDF